MKRTLGTLFAIAALTLAAGCGAKEQARSAADGAPASATTARVEKSGPLTKDNFAQRLGAAQLAAGSAHVEMTTAMQGTKLTSVGDVKIAEHARDAQVQMSMDLGVAQIEVRSTGGAMYLNLGKLSGDKFVEIDLNDPNDPITKQYGSVADQADPSAQLREFQKALVSFSNDGDGGTVDGVSTTKLTLVLDTAAVVSQRGGDQTDLGKGAPKQMTYTMRVGTDDDLVRQITADVSGTTVTIDWTKWGEPVSVEAPPASQVTDSSALAGLGAAAGMAG